MKATQSARVGGDHNITVQAAGDGIHIQVGLPRLTLVPPFNRLPRNLPGPVDLLNPYRRSIALVGREADIQSLWDWLHSPRPITVRTLVGRAGAGKTRTAIELIERLNTEHPGKWFAGFVTGTELRRFHRQENLAQWSWAGPTLVVVDYAASLVEPLRSWLSELAQHPGHSGCPLRLLLLEREASTSDGWLQSLTRGGHSDARLPELFDPLEPTRLDPLQAPEQRRRVLAEMLVAAGKLTGRKPAALPAPGANPRLDLQLAGPVWEDPLYLMMAALLSLESDLVEVLDLPRTELASQLVDHETKRLTEGTASPAAQRLLEHTAAFAALGGGLTHAQAMKVVSKAATLLGLSCPDGPGTLVERLSDLLPGPDGGVAPILPDVLAEALLLRALGQCPKATQEALLLDAVRLLGPRVIPFLIRTVQDFASEQQPLPLDLLQILIRAGQADDPGLLAQIEAAMPHQTLVLRKKAVEVNQLLIERLKRLPIQSEQVRRELARLMNNLSVRLNGLGRRDEALAQAHGAVALYGELEQAWPDAFLPDVAMSLNNLANVLSDLGQKEQALAKSEEAVRLYRQLAQARPDSFLPDVAISLNNLANRLSDLGQREQALEQAQEAVRIRRQLAEAEPRTFLPTLASSLTNLANLLNGLGRREEALEQAQEAVRLYRQLVHVRADAFVPELAGSLNNLALRLGAVGRLDEALAQAEEAVRLHRQLAEAVPDAFFHRLAASLNNLANRLSDSGRREEALARAEEAVGLYRRLARAQPDAFLPDLATSLTNRANMLGNLGRRDEALAQAEEAVRLYRQLAQVRPDAFLHNLAGSLSNLGNTLSDLGRREEALAQAQEAVAICRQLAQAQPDAFLPDLAKLLNNLGTMLSDLGRWEEALTQTQEAVRLYRQLARARPEAFLQNLAASLTNISNRLSDLGRWEEALVPAQEAVRLYRQLAQAHPDAFLHNLASSLNNLANRLTALGRREEALTEAQEAVRLHRQLAEARPNAFLPDLARCLAVQATCLTALERHSEAVQATAEAIRLLAPAFAQVPAAFAPLMNAIVQDYLYASQGAQQQPDMSLLAPVLEVLARLKKAADSK